MNRRSFLQFFAAATAALSMPALPRPAASTAVETVEVQYGEIIYCTGMGVMVHMPYDVRIELGRMAEATAATVGYPIVRREYAWFPPKCTRSDPLGQRGVGAIKYFIATPKPVFEARRDAQIAEGGWVQMPRFERQAAGSGYHVEFADFEFDSGPVRYARAVKA